MKQEIVESFVRLYIFLTVSYIDKIKESKYMTFEPDVIVRLFETHISVPHYNRIDPVLYGSLYNSYIKKWKISPDHPVVNYICILNCEIEEIFYDSLYRYICNPNVIELKEVLTTYPNSILAPPDLQLERNFEGMVKMLLDTDSARRTIRLLTLNEIVND